MGSKMPQLRLQEEVLKGKAKIQANIEELERLFPLLREQVGVEISQKLAEKTEEIEASAVAAAAAKAAEEVHLDLLILVPAQKCTLV